MLDKLFSGSTSVMARAMDALTVRQRAIAENIANADTPHYKRLEVAYEAGLKRTVDQARDPAALAVTQPGHIRLDGPQSLEEFQATLTRSDDTTMRNDGNNVDVDAEMTRLAQTSMTYNAMADLMKRKMTGLKDLIKGH